MSGKILNLVLANDGFEPLVLECFWDQQGESEPILFLDDHVKNGKVRRRAICILLLLAKLRAEEKVGKDGILEFKDGCDYLTWIGSLGNAFKEDSALTESWIRTHFKMSRSFCIGQPSTKRSPGEATVAKISYRTNVLPPNRVAIFSRNRKAAPSAKKFLEGAEFLDLAATLEDVRWNQSGKTPGIECMLRNGHLYVPKDILSHSKRFAGDNYEDDEGASATSADDLFLKTKANLIKRNASPEYDSLIKSQLKVDYDEYRKKCEPLFKWVAQWRDPFISVKERKLTKYESEFFLGNCVWFAKMVNDHNSKLVVSLKEFYDGEWTEMSCFRVYIWKPLIIAIDKIFADFAKHYRVDVVSIKAVTASGVVSIPMAVLNQWVYDVANEQSNPFLFGVLVAERLAFGDFLEHICIPHFSLPGLFKKEQIDPAKAEEVERIALDQFLNYINLVNFEAYEALFHMELCCGDSKNARLDFILGYRSTLKHITDSWTTLFSLLDTAARMA